jgi:crossover junction endodeoxyribonuclease RusA
MTVAQGEQQIEIRVWGIPAPQGSKSVRGYVAGRAILGESSKAVAPWRVDVRAATQNQYQGPILTGPVAVCATFLFSRPKGHYGSGKNADRLKPSAPKHLTSVRHGDLDKLLRSTFDGLSQSAGGGLITDDSLIVEVMANKRYVEDGELPGAYLTVTKLA